MKILHLSTFSDEGGAARAARRLHYGLLDKNCDSWLCTHKSQRGHEKSFTVNKPTKFNKLVGSVRPYVDAMPLNLLKKKENTPWSVSWLPSNLNYIIDNIKPNIVHAHWVNAGFLSLSNLKNLPAKLVWTLHDSWPFTGGCHVIDKCRFFQHACGACPQLGSKFTYDLSRIGFNRKQKLYSNERPVFIAPSNWMAEQAKSSTLLSNAEIHVIPNGLNTDLFRPLDKVNARLQLKLPITKKIILFGAMSSTSNPNKGFNKLKEVLSLLSKSEVKNNIHLAIFGANDPDGSVKLDFPVTYLGNFFDELSLATVYSAADVMCVPSMQESFCQVASEAMSCGLPVVAFATSGLLDVVEHNKTGYLAKAFDAVDFALGVETILNDDGDSLRMSILARERAIKLFDIEVVSSMHIELYETMLNKT